MTYEKMIKDKMEEIKDEVRKRSKDYEGLGEELQKAGHEGPHFGPNTKEQRDALDEEFKKAEEEFKDK